MKRDQLRAILADTSALDFFEALGALVTRGPAGEEPTASYYSQQSSPLGKRRHLEAVRSGRLPGRKVGKLVLVERADLERFLAAPPVVTTTKANDDADDGELRQWGARPRKVAGR